MSSASPISGSVFFIGAHKIALEETVSFLVKFYFIVRVFFLYVCLCSTCIPRTHRGQEKALDALDLELQTDVSYSVGAGD